MKNYLKLIPAGIILFVPFSILIYFGKSTGVLTLGFGISMVIVALLYADVIKSFKVGGAELELREVIDKANATIEMLEKAQEPVLIYTLELMYSEGMMFSSSMESKMEAFNGIKEFVKHSQTYDDKFDRKLRRAVFGVNESAYSDLHGLYNRYLKENKDKMMTELQLNEYELSRRNNEKDRQISSYFKKINEDGQLKEIVDFSGLIEFGKTELTDDYQRKWNALIVKLKDFNEKNKY